MTLAQVVTINARFFHQAICLGRRCGMFSLLHRKIQRSSGHISYAVPELSTFHRK